MNLSLIRVKITLPVSALHCDSDTFDSPPLLLIPTPKDCQTGTSFHWILVLQLPAFCATSCYYYRKACLKKPQKKNKKKNTPAPLFTENASRNVNPTQTGTYRRVESELHVRNPSITC